jgi:hypothetical protein
MDPLSLTASIIAVVSAGAALAKGLKKLYELKEAREEVCRSSPAAAFEEARTDGPT